MPLGLSLESSVFGCVGGVGAEVFGDAGEAEPRLFKGFGREIVECFGV